MTLDRRAALVQLASMLKSAHGQLTHIYRAEQEQTEAQHVLEQRAGKNYCSRLRHEHGNE